MPNIALTWPELKGVDMTPHDGMEGLANMLADKPTKADRGRFAALIQERHGRPLAQRIVDRAREILEERRNDHG